MIGSFHYRPSPHRDGEVSVHLFFNNAMEPLARVHLPATARRQLLAEEGLDIATPRELGSALALGVFWATRIECSLMVTGDASAWPNHWGALRQVASV